MSRPFRIGVLLLTLCLAALRLPAWAEEPDDTPALPVPARLSIVEGTASFWRPGDDGWSPAQVNMALAAGDAVVAGDGSTVEIQIGPRAYVRLMAGTQVELVRQDVERIEMRLADGAASFDLRALPAGQTVQVNTPNAALALAPGGYYRASFDDGVSRFVVRRGGRATLGLSDGYQRPVVDGEQMIVRGTTQFVAEVAPAPAPDSWDRWNDARSDYYERAASNRYLPPEVYGAADLDQHGTWRELPDYGPAWEPAVPPGWTPFSTGVWRWDPVYEWTWVDHSPWGWAPSHYGRWVFWSNRWVWVPGPRVARPVYLPAVVAFIGFGSDPRLGWVALSWGEPVVPWWGPRGLRGRVWWGGWGGPRLVNNVVVHPRTTVNVNTIVFRNTQYPRTVITVRQEVFDRHRELRSRDHDFHAWERGSGTPRAVALPSRHASVPATVAAPPLRHRPVADAPNTRPKLVPQGPTELRTRPVMPAPTAREPAVDERRVFEERRRNEDLRREDRRTFEQPDGRDSTPARGGERREWRRVPDGQPATAPREVPAARGSMTIQRSPTEATPQREMRSVETRARSSQEGRHGGRQRPDDREPGRGEVSRQGTISR